MFADSIGRREGAVRTAAVVTDEDGDGGGDDEDGDCRYWREEEID